ncbi:MAG: ABC-F family ATP-binding cassette domain-containing protein [Clostridia bacterium]
MSLITLENIRKKYSEKVILDGVSLTVQKNERVALVGSNGSGKTTLLKIIMGMESPDDGRVIIPKAARIGYVSQSFNDFYNEESDRTTATTMAEIDSIESRMREIELEMAKTAEEGAISRLMAKYDVLNARFEAIDGYAFEKMLQAALNGLGLNRHSLTVPLSRLSGGEKLRVMLARIIISKPDILVLDEPTNHLDIKALDWLEKYLANFRGGVLFVSHDRYFLDRVATRVIELEFGTVRGMKSSYTEYLNQKKVLLEFHVKKQRDIERQIKNEKKIVQTLRHQRKISAFNSRLKKIEKLQEQLTDVRKEGATLHLGRIPSGVLNMNHDIHISADVAFAENLGKRFGERVLFENASFVIKGGDKVGIIGDNGSGKTTLLNILSGRDSDFTGKASIGNWIKYGFISQDVIFEDETITVLDKLTQESKAAGESGMSRKEALEYAANYKFFGDETSKTLSVLSGGERSRLALAIVMLGKPNCLVMDEPTNHLDIYTKEIMEDAFSRFRGTVIAISHDRYFLNNCVTRILAVENGGITVVEGNYDAYLNLGKGGVADPEPENPDEAKRVKYDNHMEKLRVGRLAKAKADRNAARLALEEEIDGLEDFKEGFEACMNAETTYEQYLDYQDKVKKLEDLYGQWDEFEKTRAID